jgi:hypothetical protein
MPKGPKHRPTERRFLDKANVLGGWQLTCSCGRTSKIIATPKTRGLPPNIIVKKLKRLGWRVGIKPAGDMCPECQRRPFKSHIGLAKKALTDMTAPMVTAPNGKRVPFAEVEATVSHINDPEEVKRLIEVLRHQLPPKSPRREKSPPPPHEPQDEYEAWLDRVDPQK